MTGGCGDGAREPYSAMAGLLRLIVVAATGVDAMGAVAAPPAPRPRAESRAEETPAGDELVDGAWDPPREPPRPGAAAAIRATEGPPEPPRGCIAPPPPVGAASCHGVDRPAD